MDELISRQAAIKDAESWVAVDEHERHLQKNVIEWLKKFPSAQPVIIRCKDCKHYEYGICKKAGLCVNKSPNGFCDWGERREVTE